MARYLLALCITVAVEVPVVAALYRGERVRMATLCGGVTAATNLAMHLVLPDFAPTYESWLIAGELGALGVEAAAYGRGSREFGWPRALIAASLANSASFAAGLYI